VLAAERLVEARAIWPGAELAPAIEPPAHQRDQHVDRETAVRELVRSRLDASGPVTAAALGDTLGLPEGEIDGALHALEAEGAVLRGQFTSGVRELEWCERRLLARIHRYTLDRLRKEIAPVSQQDFMRFLLAHQRVGEGEQASGPSGLASVLEQLAGVEAPAASWEGDLLPARVAGYDPSWLDQLCLAGHVVWARLSAPASGTVQRPLRVTPIAVLPRASLALQVMLRASSQTTVAPRLSANAERVRQALASMGACFTTDLEAHTLLLPSQLQDALAELAAAGVATSDAYGGLRALLVPSRLRGRHGGLRAGAGGWTVSAAQGVPAAKRTPGTHARGLSSGRWALVPSVPGASELDDAALEAIARTLLARYGVLFRKLLERETAPPWRLLCRVLRRMEASGELRGGRFVDGFTGEQFALPSAVERLRQIRRSEPSGRTVVLSAADPLNLFGTTLPGERIAALSRNRLLVRDGALLAALEKNTVRFFADEPSPEARWNDELSLRKRQIPVALRPYLQA
jgi:ATP-dependent Lhr-like helicase